MYLQDRYISSNIKKKIVNFIKDLILINLINPKKYKKLNDVLILLYYLIIY